MTLTTLFSVTPYNVYQFLFLIPLPSFFSFFWSGLRDCIACSLLGGIIPSQSSGYTVTILCPCCIIFLCCKLSQHSISMAFHPQGLSLAPLHLTRSPQCMRFSPPLPPPTPSLPPLQITSPIPTPNPSLWPPLPVPLPPLGRFLSDPTN